MKLLLQTRLAVSGEESTDICGRLSPKETPPAIAGANHGNMLRD